MLRAVIANWLRPKAVDTEPEEGRTAYHSDIRAIRPDAWAAPTPVARGRDVERAMWLSGVTSADFREVVDIVLTPHLIAPAHDIVEACKAHATACKERADALTDQLPLPNPYGRPPLPWHRDGAREATRLYRAARAWDTLGRLLLSNRWHR